MESRSYHKPYTYGILNLNPIGPAGNLQLLYVRACLNKPGPGMLSIRGGSWVVISRVTILITHIRGLITPLITTCEPPSRGSWQESFKELEGSGLL